MPSRRSDILNDRLRPKVRPWREALVSNAPVPIAILLLWPLSYLVEGGGQGPFSMSLIGDYSQRIVMLIGFGIILAVSLQLINGFSGQFSLGHAGFMAVGAYLCAYPAKAFSKNLADPATPLLFFVSFGIVTVVVGFFLLGVFVALRASGRAHRLLPGLLVLVLLIWLLVDFSQSAKYEHAPAWFVWTHSAQQVQHLFLWIIERGTPIAQSISGMIPVSLRPPLCFLVLVLGGGCCAGVVGLIVGMPALRLRGDYLAIATLGMAEIIRIGIQNSRPLGSALGLQDIPYYTDFIWLYTFAVVTVVVIWRIAYSAKGRAIMAVREDEVAAAAVGIDTTHHKVMAFVIGAFFAGIAGALFALHERSITPSTFGLQKSIEIVVMVTLGGLGSISGAILAAIVLTMLPELLRAINEYRMIIYSLLLVLMMLVRPQGLLGGRELWPKRRGPKVEAVATEDRDDIAPAPIS